MTLAISGANGYIGTRLVKLALARNQRVVALTRRQPALANLAWLPYDLASATTSVLPAGVTALVHLAATVHTTAVDVEAEVSAARGLIGACQAAGARFIFVSSQTAREDAPTAYGRAKWLIEQHTLAAGGLVLRPGLVYGSHERALFGQLVALVRKSPVLPAFLPAPQVQPVHVDDLAAAIFTAATRPALPPAIYCVGAPVPVTFTCFLQGIATQWLRRGRMALPVSAHLVRLTGKLMGPGLSASLGLDRLESLFDLPPMQTAADLALLGMHLRPLDAGMQRSGNDRRRKLLREGHALLAYTLRMQPAPALLRRYVRCIEQLRDAAALDLPGFVQRRPALLALLDERRLQGGEFLWRMNAAVVIGEASTQGAQRYLRIGQPAGFVRDGCSIALALGSELGWRMLRLGATPFMQARLRRVGLWK